MSFKAHNLVFCKNLGFLEQLYFYSGFKGAKNSTSKSHPFLNGKPKDILWKHIIFLQRFFFSFLTN